MELPLFHVTMSPLEKELPQPPLLTPQGRIHHPPFKAKTLALCQCSGRPHLRHGHHDCSLHCAYTRPAPREPPLPFPRDLFLDTERKMHGENHLSEVIFFFFCLNNLTFTLDKVFCIPFIT